MKLEIMDVWKLCAFDLNQYLKTHLITKKSNILQNKVNVVNITEENNNMILEKNNMY